MNEASLSKKNIYFMKGKWKEETKKQSKNCSVFVSIKKEKKE
jgi:hypothetical protein